MFYAVYLLFVLLYLFMGIGGADKGIYFADQTTLRFVVVPCILMHKIFPCVWQSLSVCFWEAGPGDLKVSGERSVGEDGNGYGAYFRDGLLSHWNNQRHSFYRLVIS